jgi:hypothetical protein
MTRNGKIARLPDPVRQELNARLEKGEEGAPLLRWLNARPESSNASRKTLTARPSSNKISRNGVRAAGANGGFERT